MDGETRCLVENNVVFDFYAHPRQSASSLTGPEVCDTKENRSSNKEEKQECARCLRGFMSLKRLVLEGCAELPERFKSWQDGGTRGCDVASLGDAPGA